MKEEAKPAATMADANQAPPADAEKPPPTPGPSPPSAFGVTSARRQLPLIVPRPELAYMNVPVDEDAMTFGIELEAIFCGFRSRVDLYTAIRDTIVESAGNAISKLDYKAGSNKDWRHAFWAVSPDNSIIPRFENEMGAGPGGPGGPGQAGAGQAGAVLAMAMAMAPAPRPVGVVVGDGRGRNIDKAHGVEIISPKLLAGSRASYDTIARVMAQLRRRFDILINRTCGFHVHVGINRGLFSLLDVKKIGSVLWFAESRLQRLYHPKRCVSSRDDPNTRACGELRRYSNLAKGVIQHAEDINVAIPDGIVPGAGDVPREEASRQRDVWIASFLDGDGGSSGDSSSSSTSKGDDRDDKAEEGLRGGPAEEPRGQENGVAVPKISTESRRAMELLWSQNRKIETCCLLLDDPKHEARDGVTKLSVNVKGIYCRTNSNIMGSVPANASETHYRSHEKETWEFRKMEGTFNPSLAVHWAKTCQCIIRFGMQSSPEEFTSLLRDLLKGSDEYRVVDFLKGIGCEEETWKFMASKMDKHHYECCDHGEKQFVRKFCDHADHEKVYTGNRLGRVNQVPSN